MVETKKCLDTYALVEIYKANSKFSHYLSSDFVINDLILAEFYLFLLREKDEKTADFWVKKLEPYSVSVSREILIEAIKFRYENRKSDISFFDAVGYVFSIKNGCVFVTGDKEFKNGGNVEFREK